MDKDIRKGVMELSYLGPFQDMTEWKVGKMIYMYVCVKIAGDFSGGPVVKTSFSNSGGLSSLGD